uniref:Uncharacterized protein n=1 Tax=Caenorhabditis tropicalis TaxID=1561998 RepID=A0A1I7T9J7_9PELO
MKRRRERQCQYAYKMSSEKKRRGRNGRSEKIRDGTTHCWIHGFPHFRRFILRIEYEIKVWRRRRRRWSLNITVLEK